MRKETDVWIIGPCSDSLSQTKLPTIRQVLSLFFYLHKVEMKTVRDSSRAAVRATLHLWEKARIPTTIERNAIEKLEKAFDQWVRLKKSSTRRTESQAANEAAFGLSIAGLFDIAHADALQLISNPEDRAFLIDQRGARKFYMAGVDKKLAEREERAKERRFQEKARENDEEKKREAREKTVVLTSSSSDSDTSKNDDGSITNATGMLSPPKRRRPQPMVTPELSSALDRSNVSDRNATFVLAAAAHSLGHNVADLAINRQSIRRARIQCRSAMSQELKARFPESKGPLTVHWDAKLLPDITGKEHVERLPIVVTGCGIEKLIAVPKLQDGTGESSSTAVVESLRDWGIQDQISSMCFDTTAANTGRRGGACHLIEQKMEKDLLHLACRHHIYEVVIGDVFKHCFGASSGPDVLLFKRFQQNWSKIDQKVFETALGDQICLQVLQANFDLKKQAVEFATHSLSTTNQPRDDYRELLEIVLVFLGETPPRGIRFMAPGAFHRARWMAKVLYSIKIWLFRGQFHLTQREEKGLRDMCLFASLAYAKAWITCPTAMSAPKNDLNFLKQLVSYAVVNEGVSSAALTAFKRHLWYLSEELVALSFFDPEVSVMTKKAMVQALSRPGSEDVPKRIVVDSVGINAKQLNDFVSENTCRFFQILNIPFGFLENVEVEHWERSNEFQGAKMIAEYLRVVNDAAERGVKLIQDFNSSATKNEEQKQYLLQVIAEHRRAFPEAKKCLLLEPGKGNREEGPSNC